MHGLEQWFYFWSGAKGGAPVNLWGGIISDATLFLGFVQVLRHLNCHTKGCWRRGTHLTATGYKLCKKCVAKPLSELALHEVHPDHLAA